MIGIDWFGMHVDCGEENISPTCKKNCGSPLMAILMGSLSGNGGVDHEELKNSCCFIYQLMWIEDLIYHVKKTEGKVKRKM